MHFNKFKKISISFFLIVFLFSAFYFLFFDGALAAEVSLSCDKNPKAYPWCSEAKSGNFGVLVNRFYVIALGLGAASAFGVLIYGAILWTMSGAVTSKQDAMEWISGAIWGLVLLLGAYLILYTINPTLVALKNPGGLISPVTVAPPGIITNSDCVITPSLCGTAYQCDAAKKICVIRDCSASGFKGACSAGYTCNSAGVCVK